MMRGRFAVGVEAVNTCAACLPACTPGLTAMSTVIENARMHRAALEWLCLVLRSACPVARGAYNLIPLSDLMGALERRTLADLPPKPLVISFDDGHRSNYELIDILRELPASPTPARPGADVPHRPGHTSGAGR
jgi:hypothetical protein